MLITWNIDTTLYTSEQLKRLLDVVEGMDCSIASDLWECIVESEINPEKT